MNWLALLGILAAGYGVFAIVIAWQRPAKIWYMSKVQGFVKRIGNRATSIWFTVFGLAMIGLGVWLIVK